MRLYKVTIVDLITGNYVIQWFTTRMDAIRYTNDCASIQHDDLIEPIDFKPIN